MGQPLLASMLPSILKSITMMFTFLIEIRSHRLREAAEWYLVNEEEVMKKPYIQYIDENFA